MSKKNPYVRSALPLDAVILGIDSAATSGWVVLAPLLCDGRWRDHRLSAFGSVRTPSGRRHAIHNAQNLSLRLGAPLIAVGESWVGTGSMSSMSIAGLGASWGRWAEQLEIAGHPKARTLRLDTGTWRQQIFGKSIMNTKVAKAKAISWARARHGVTMTDDEAEAACIAQVASRWEQARRKLPKAFR